MSGQHCAPAKAGARHGLPVLYLTIRADAGSPWCFRATRTTLSDPQPRPARAASANRNAQRFSAFPLETTRSGARALTALTVWLEDSAGSLPLLGGGGTGFPYSPFGIAKGVP